MTETLDFLIFMLMRRKALFSVQLLFMEYFSCKGAEQREQCRGNFLYGPGKIEPRRHHDTPAAAMVTNPPEGLWVDI